MDNFDLTMTSTRCRYCKAIPELPYDGAVVVTRKHGALGEHIICSTCLEEIDKLSDKVKDLQKEIGSKDDVLNRKNLELDALAHVWCSGGCESGVFRYNNDIELTAEQVGMVERNTVRLRYWFEAKRCRNAVESGTPMEKCESCTSKANCFKKEK